MANVVLEVAAQATQAALTAAASAAIAQELAPDVYGPRLDAVRVQGAGEGAGLPIIYGRARVAGQVIWATRYAESTSSEPAGGKGGGPDAVGYQYRVSFAVALGSGVIDGVGRIWANGRLLSQADVTYRVYKGREDQAPDPLIETVEGAGDVPAFRGVAYVVFEDLPLDGFGNRIPQLNFEVFRAPPPLDAAPRLETALKGVTLIPGSGEFAYATTPVRREIGAGEDAFENLNNGRGVANIVAAIDDLQAQLPACDSVMIVTSWFGDDLRCGTCQIRPGVDAAEKTTAPMIWVVNGQSRSSAYLVSQINGAPAYGGTPDDESLIEAIALLKARGFKVGLYPFILMDIPSGNGLADPFGGAQQAAHPWRGRITCHPAPGQPGSPDKTVAASGQISAFFGTCAAADFSTSSGGVTYAGPAEWGLRRMILHYAHLAQLAGGVDTFLIGSELRGLTTVRDGVSSYPAVSELKDLATDVRSVLGAGTAISYAADWSEYFGHHPADGSGDVHFHLDPLWADASIDFVGIDWYAPLTDWRDGAVHADAQLSADGRDHAYLMANVEAAEGYEWYYASAADRDAQTRTPITDGQGEPWVFRYKDLKNWWASTHYNRPGGVKALAPTAWTPQSKPIRFVEIGCPAVDKGANQPNVFIDSKSSESFAPYYSSGARDDVIQRRYIEAHLRYWAAATGNNPVSNQYAGRMLDLSSAHAWTWDARPYPDFPARTDVWSDGDNWRLGHWLTGRMGLAEAGAILTDLAASAGVTATTTASSDLLAGYVIDRPMSARAAMEPLAAALGVEVRPSAGGLSFLPANAAPSAALSLQNLVLDDQSRRLERVRAADDERISQANVRFYDEAGDYQVAALSVGAADGGGVDRTIAGPFVTDRAGAAAMAERVLALAAAGQDQLRVIVPPSAAHLELGDSVTITELPGRAYRIVTLSEDPARRALLVRVADGPGIVAGADPGVQAEAPAPPSRPQAHVLDLPLLPGETTRSGPRIAAAATPWPGEIVAAAGANAASAKERGRVVRTATTGVLVWDLYPGPVGRWDEGNRVQVRLDHGALASAATADVLAGANVLAIGAPDGEWEVVQFRNAVLVSPGVYEISGLLRGQSGTEPGMAAVGAYRAAGAPVVALNGATHEAVLEAHERGASLTWLFAAAGRVHLTADRREITHTYSGRHLRPLSPVHITAARTAQGVALAWVRRTRVNGDDWAAADAPLGEEAEAYLVEILIDNAPVWSKTVTTPSAVLPSAEEAAAFPGAPVNTLTVRIAQVSPAYGPGAAQTQTVSF